MTFMLSDIEIAQQTPLKPIAEIARQLGIMDWLTDDVDWMTGDKHPHIEKLFAL